MDSAFEEYLRQLAEPETPISVAKLGNLSNLSREEVTAAETLWRSLPLERRCQIASHLVDLAEDNVELNFAPVLRIALEDAEGAVRAKAIEGLSEASDPWVMDSLIKLMIGDSEEAVRAAAATGLRRFSLMAELEEMGPARAGRLEKALMAVIDDPKETAEVRRRAMEAASPLSRPRIKEIIAEAYRSEDPRMRASAVFSMGQNCDPAWLPVVLQELKSSSPEMRFEAAVAAGEIADESAVAGLLRLLQDKDTDVRLAAICALGHIASSEAQTALHPLLGNPDERIRAAAEEALQEIAFNRDPLSFGM
ncbi:MAG: HEAT repeat domain-containing protein [Chloroflexi bacterium]|nr:HEAT repeat domain-containing protein [Chloroflexota bacterium]